VKHSPPSSMEPCSNPTPSRMVRRKREGWAQVDEDLAAAIIRAPARRVTHHPMYLVFDEDVTANRVNYDPLRSKETK